MVEKAKQPPKEPQLPRQGEIWTDLEADPSFVAGMEEAKAEHDTTGFKPFVHNEPPPIGVTRTLDSLPGFTDAWKEAKRAHENGEFETLDTSFIDRFLESQE